MITLNNVKGKTNLKFRHKKIRNLVVEQTGAVRTMKGEIILFMVPVNGDYGYIDNINQIHWEIVDD